MSMFSLKESPFFANKYVISVDYNEELFPNGGTSGSYNVLVARFLNLTYADYLRYARDQLGAELVGKGRLYVIPYFENTENVRTLIMLLNARARFVLKERRDRFVIERKDDGTLEKVPLEFRQ